jgi:hypothetical protein
MEAAPITDRFGVGNASEPPGDAASLAADLTGRRRLGQLKRRLSVVQRSEIGHQRSEMLADVVGLADRRRFSMSDV